LLTIVVSELSTLFGNPINIWRVVAHHPHVVGREIPKANVIAPDDEHIGLVLRQRLASKYKAQQKQYNAHGFLPFIVSVAVGYCLTSSMATPRERFL